MDGRTVGRKRKKEGKRMPFAGFMHAILLQEFFLLSCLWVRCACLCVHWCYNDISYYQLSSPSSGFSSSKSRREQGEKWTYRLKVKRNYDKKANEQGKCIKIKIKKAFANIHQSKEIWTCDELNDLWNVKLAKLCRKHIFMLGRWWLFSV